MAKKIQVQGQVLIITSGNAPTVETLKKGQIAYGTVDGKPVIYGSDGENILKLSTEGLTTDVTEAIESAVNALKAAVDAYTVNGRKISTNPVLTAEDIKFGTTADAPTVYAQLNTTGSNARQALDKANTNEQNIKELNDSKGAADGLATLDGSGKVPASQLPSYVDDVVDLVAIAATGNIPTDEKEGDVYYNSTDKKLYTAMAVSSGGDTYIRWDRTSAADPESGKIYINVGDGNKSYRWSGTEMVQIQGGGIVVGTTSGTAFDGAKGAAVEAKAAQNATAITALQTDLNGLTVELTVTEI